jgi:hypothetical protein
MTVVTALRGSARDVTEPPAPATHAELGADLLAAGYLSAVAHELEQRCIAETRLRPRPPAAARMSGTLDLEVINMPDGLTWGVPISTEWDEIDGWSALLRCRSGGTARRYLHAGVVVAPATVADYIAELIAGRDVGLLYPVSCLGGGRGHRLLPDLGEYALPAVRRWLRQGRVRPGRPRRG